MPGSPQPITLDDVRRALRQPRPGSAAQARMWPVRQGGPASPVPSEGGRAAAVLILVYPHEGIPHIVLTRRTETVQNHKGQVSFPGGAREGNETAQQTALREAREELGIAAAGLDILGTLTPVYVAVSDYLVTPVVAIASHRPAFHPDPVEVVEAIETPLALLVDHAVRREEDWQIRGHTVRVPYFAIGQHKVWGATAMILAEFAALLEAVVQ
jgi:8-oxo-dGTP pyrophosphatase MutT (NUDIX family)